MGLWQSNRAYEHRYSSWALTNLKMSLDVGGIADMEISHGDSKNCDWSARTAYAFSIKFLTKSEDSSR